MYALRRPHLIVAVCLCAGFFWNATAQQVQPVQRNNSVSFYSIASLIKPVGAQPTLRGARLANPPDWPASFYSVHPRSSCTATLVGPRALLTAAHCVPDGGSAVITFGGNTYNGVCTRSSAYPGEISADWALCLMETDIPVTQFETVSTDASRLALGTELLLTGFGCTTSAGKGGNDGNYRVGEAKIDKLPAGSDNDIETDGPVALCFGDSGGPAFLYLDPAKKHRVEVSVNSRISTTSANVLGRRSFLSSLSTTQAKSFLTQWVGNNKVTICGVSSGAIKCRT